MHFVAMRKRGKRGFSARALTEGRWREVTRNHREVAGGPWGRGPLAKRSGVQWEGNPEGQDPPPVERDRQNRTRHRVHDSLHVK